MYVKALAILLLLSGLIVGLWKLYDAIGDSREAKVRLEWATEKIQLADKIGELKQKAENQIIEDRIVYRDRIQKVREVVNDCVVPDSIVRLHHDSGVYSGEVRPADLQRADP
jgi:hypothetical protein